MLEPALGILPQAIPDDAFDFPRQAGYYFGDGLGLLAEDGGHSRGLTVTPERSLARQHLVQQRTETEDIRTGIDALAFHLLRRHVGGGADDLAFLGMGYQAARRFVLTLSDRFGQFRDAKVEDLDQPVLVHHDVARLQVAVDDACRVRAR